MASFNHRVGKRVDENVTFYKYSVTERFNRRGLFRGWDLSWVPPKHESCDSLLSHVRYTQIRIQCPFVDSIPLNKCVQCHWTHKNKRNFHVLMDILSKHEHRFSTYVIISLFIWISVADISSALRYSCETKDEKLYFVWYGRASFEVSSLVRYLLWPSRWRSTVPPSYLRVAQSLSWMKCRRALRLTLFEMLLFVYEMERIVWRFAHWRRFGSRWKQGRGARINDRFVSLV